MLLVRISAALLTLGFLYPTMWLLAPIYSAVTIRRDIKFLRGHLQKVKNHEFEAHQLAALGRACKRKLADYPNVRIYRTTVRYTKRALDRGWYKNPPAE
jgi:hypothetical protein